MRSVIAFELRHADHDESNERGSQGWKQLIARVLDESVLPLLQSLGIDAYEGYASGKPQRIA